MELLFASTASVVANFFTHPLETIKVRQMMSGKSTVALSFRIVREEGILAFYKGFSAAVVRAIISGGGRLYGYSSLKSIAEEYEIISCRAEARDLPVLSVLAISSACLAQFGASPIDLIRTRQAANKRKGFSPSIYRVASDVVAQDGIKGLFSGSTALLFRAATFNLGQLLTYDKCKYKFSSLTGIPTTDYKVHIFASLGAGLAATTFSCPAENLKTYGQLYGRKPVLTAIRDIYSKNGIQTFFRGWTPLYAKVGPHTFIVFVTLEFLRGHYS